MAEGKGWWPTRNGAVIPAEEESAHAGAPRAGLSRLDLALQQGPQRASPVAQLVKNPPAVQETQIGSLGWEDPWRRERLPTPVFWPEEVHELYSPWGSQKSQTQLSNFH